MNKSIFLILFVSPFVFGYFGQQIFDDSVSGQEYDATERPKANDDRDHYETDCWCQEQDNDVIELEDEEPTFA